MFKTRQNARKIADRKFEMMEIDNPPFELTVYGTRISRVSIVKTDGFCAIKREPERMMER